MGGMLTGQRALRSVFKAVFLLAAGGCYWRDDLGCAGKWCCTSGQNAGSQATSPVRTTHAKVRRRPNGPSPGMWFDLREEMKRTGHITWSPEHHRRQELKQDSSLVRRIVLDLVLQPNRLQEAEAWYELIADETVNPVALNSLIHTFAKVGKLQRALHWAEVLHESGFELNQEVMWILLYECGRQNNFVAAEALLTHEMLEMRPQIMGAFLVACVDQGQLSTARRWLSKMEEVSDRNGGAMQLGFLEGIAKAAQPDLAHAWWRYVRRKNVTPQREHYDALITACRKDFSEAKRWFQQLKDDGFTPEVSSYTALLEAAPSADLAEDWLQQMLNDNLRPNARTSCALVQAAARSFNANRAVEYLKMFQDGAFASEESSYNAALGALAREKRHAEVEELLREMKEVTTPNIVTYNNILVNCARSVDEEGVALWLECMKEAGHSPDVVTCNAMAGFNARLGRVKTAFEWIDRLKALGFSPTTLSYSPVVLALARASDTKGVAESLRKMMDDTVMPNAVALSAVLESFVVQEDVAGADSLLSKLLAANVELDQRTFDTIVRLCSRQGAHQLATKWFKHAVRLGGMKSACASAGCASLAAVGETSQAAALLQNFEDGGLSMKVRAYASLAKAWAVNGRIVLAVYTISRMYAAGHQCTSLTWATILEACRSKPRRPAEAQLLLRCMAERKAAIPGDRAMSALLWTFGEKRLERLLCNLWLKVGPAPSRASIEDIGEEPCWSELQRLAFLPPADYHTHTLKRIRSPRTELGHPTGVNHYYRPGRERSKS